MTKDDRIAYYSNRYRTIEYWTSRNTTTVVNCDNVHKAKSLIKNSGVEQELRVKNG